MKVTDMYGNSIEVSDLNETIKQAEFLKDSPFKQSPFKLVNGQSLSVFRLPVRHIT